MQKQWVFPKEPTEEDIVGFLLKNRGIIEEDEHQEFLSDSPQLTHDPFLLKHMDEAVNRILSAIENNEKICIYGDYDADGVCSVSLLIELLEKLKAHFSYYIPSRFDEGYGLNIEAIDKIKSKGFNLLITVDCGSVSYDEVKYANEIGVEVIVTDHHNLNDKPASCLLINPRQKGCQYPNKNLSGCGVAFKLAQGIQRRRPDLIGKSDLNMMLDLVAIATIGDIVPLFGENRTMVKYGLKNINKSKRPGLSLLIEKTGLKDKEIKSDQVAYVIVPHLNAAGRMGYAKTGVELLASPNEEERTRAAERILASNQKRKTLQDATFLEAVEQVERFFAEDRFIILELPQAHEGITGIVAGKIKDMFNRPAIILTPTDNNRLKGTGRSIEGINLYELLYEHRDLYEKFGGHGGACGLTMRAENIDEFRRKLGETTEKLYHENPSLFQAKLHIDAELRAAFLDKKLISSIEKLEPFGHKNPKPVFALRGAKVKNPFYMGDNKQHVRFEADDLACVIFNEAERFKKIFETNMTMSLAGYPEINRWNGNEKVQLLVEDICLEKEKI